MTTNKRPRGQRVTEETKYQVLNALMEYLPQRSQARFRVVSTSVKEMVSTSLKPPVYAPIIEEIHTFFQKDWDNAYVAMFVSPHKVLFTVSKEYKKELPNTIEVTVDITAEDDAYEFIVSKCKPANFKKNLYRAIALGQFMRPKLLSQRRKPQCPKMTLGEALERISADTEHMVHFLGGEGERETFGLNPPGIPYYLKGAAALTHTL